MKIDFVGDIHGEFGTLRGYCRRTDADVVIQVGDFGQMPKINSIVDPYIPFATRTLFIPGNHDDHSWLRGPGPRHELPEGLEYLGRVGSISLDARVIAYLGGGYSFDRFRRTEGIDWWRDEEPFKWEMEEFSDYRPDIAISHEGPANVTAHMMGKDISNSTAVGLNNLIQLVPEFKPKIWLFGHHHPEEMEFWFEHDINFVCLPIFYGHTSQVFKVRTDSNLTKQVDDNYKRIRGKS